MAHQERSAVRLLLIGAPGAGKGTQAVRIAEHFGLTHLSSGDLLRSHMRAETDIGRSVKSYIETGDLVPDAIVMDMLRKPVVQASAEGGYILDGFPRTVDQAHAAYLVARELQVQVQIAVHLKVSQDELIRRLTARGRGAEDTPEIVKHRLEVYASKTVPLLGYYLERERLVSIDGAQSADKVGDDLIAALTEARDRLHLDAANA